MAVIILQSYLLNFPQGPCIVGICFGLWFLYRYLRVQQSTVKVHGYMDPFVSGTVRKKPFSV